MTPSVEDWRVWLQEWNRQLLAKHDPATPNAFIDPLVTPAVLDTGWLGAPGATEAEVVELETRLGTTLPPSYRSFLRTTNGFLQPGVIVPRLLAAGEVGWLRDLDPETVEIWTRGAANTPGHPDSFEHHLPSVLQVSARETIGTATYVLNPEVIGADGEWEAFFFAHWVPGVNRFPSFWDLMQAEQRDVLAPSLPPPTRAKTIVETMRSIFRGSKPTHEP